MGKVAENSLDIYLKPTFAIDADHERIIEIARSLTADYMNDREKTVKLFYFVRDLIRYNINMISVFLEDFKASRILEWGKGYCVQKAVLLTTLGRAAGVPSRLIFAKIRNHKLPAHIYKMRGSNIFPRHGYNQFYLNGKWVAAATTFHREMCEEIGVPPVEFDGESDAILPEKDLRGEPYIEYIDKFPPQEDLPFDWIVREISKIVGPDKRPWLNKNVKE